MREITAQLDGRLKAHFGDSAAKAEPYPVERYNDLVRIVAELSYLNRESLLAFRGQARDFKNKAEASSLYPTLYRRNVLTKARVGRDFALLDELSTILVEESRKLDRRTGDELRKRRYLSQSILQHYQVCETPLLDLSQSLRAACSFAQISAAQSGAAAQPIDPSMAGSAPGERVYLYVLALPFPTGGISIDYREEIVSVRLLSACPSLARRPYFQDALLAGTVDISDNYEDKNELDFNRRLVTKFSIPAGGEFWEEGSGRIDSALLFPGKDEDPMLQLCSSLHSAVASLEGLLFAPAHPGAPQGEEEDTPEKATFSPSGEAVLGVQDIAYRLRRRLG
ncbi:MAG: FRG domain-containing protein [Spirochaetia bacterium]|jgi:hypothetical protein|nr:FRG domain-containing protein [Spirochaetia bacterium]